MTRGRVDVGLLLILVAAGLVRVHLAVTESYIHDEENTSIPLSQQISFSAGDRYLPLRAVNHPALPAYIVKAGSSLVGPTRFGYRAAHVVTGLLAVLAGVSPRAAGLRRVGRTVGGGAPGVQRVLPDDLLARRPRTARTCSS